MNGNTPIIYPEETTEKREPVLRSVIAPAKPTDIRDGEFEANGKTYKVSVDLNAYTTRIVRGYSRDINKADKIEDEDEREDRQFEVGLDFALIGAVETDAPVKLNRDGLLDANFNVSIGLIEAVQSLVFPNSSDSQEQ